MSEEEKKAIEYLKRHLIPYESKNANIEFLVNDVILNLIEKQQKEIDFYKGEELGYIAGYEDGKKHKQTAVAIKNENAQQELFQKEIGRLKEIIEKQRKEIKEYTKFKKNIVNRIMMWDKKELPDNEIIINVLDTFIAEISRLEDIEDRKIQVEVKFIEEKRDKFWKDKIGKLLEEYKDTGYYEVEQVLEDLRGE